jgi:hypothetical protein
MMALLASLINLNLFFFYIFFSFLVLLVVVVENHFYDINSPSLPSRGDQAVKAHTTRVPAPPSH